MSLNNLPYTQIYIFHIYSHKIVEKVTAWWVQKTLMIDQKAQHVCLAAKHLHRFELVGNMFIHG
jgi:hypothetical protein